MPVPLLIFLGVPALLVLLATGAFAGARRARGGDPVAVPARRPPR